MSAQDELPPGWDDSFLDVGKRRDAQLLVVWTHWERKSGITRDEYTTMRAAVERCAELERLVDDAEHGRATALTVRDAQAERCSKAEAALAKVTAERDAARHSAEVYRDAWAEILDDDDPEDKNHLSWERATPTEGE